MKLELFDYQRDAALDVLERFAQARTMRDQFQTPSAFGLAATTGAGKTIIATAVIEAMLFGSADLQCDHDPTATFLWVTDAPALNRQTMNRMIAASDLLDPYHLSILNDGYLEQQLKANRVYFLNIQQLASNSLFARGQTNARQISGWELITNTIAAPDVNLHVVVDEAHRGITSDRERTTVVRRIIDGHDNHAPPAPIVWGISATLERFETTMSSIEDRTKLPAVTVDVDKIRASGLIKDYVVLAEPGESGTYTTTLLRQAAATLAEFTTAWADYAATENEPLVTPVLVVQVADKATDSDLAQHLDIITNEVPDLGPYAVVNVLGEHSDLTIDGRLVRYIAPELIQDDPHARVVIAKEAITTGWDCPRAEVLYSDRPASDDTHIAQTIGRMVRSPLARRIATVDLLNTVRCYLPSFQRSALTSVVAELNNPGEIGAASTVTIGAAEHHRSDNLDDEVFDYVAGLPSWPQPDRLASPMRRARTLAKLLTDASSGQALLPDAGAALTSRLNARLAGLMAEYADQVHAGVEDLETATIRLTSVDHDGNSSVETLDLPTAPGDLANDTRRVVGSVREGVARDFQRHLTTSNPDEDPLTVQTQVAALLNVDGVVESITGTAEQWTQQQLSTHRVAIEHTTGARRAAFIRVREQSSEQEQVGIELPTSLTAPTHTTSGVSLPRFEGHLFTDRNGRFPADLNGWESTVVNTEIARSAPEFVAWYRNPSRATTAALRIGYPIAVDQWSSLQPDFLVISRRDDGTLGAAILDPHGDQFADSLPKLHGLARYAEHFGEHFLRIEAITDTASGFRVLNLLDQATRGAVKAHTQADVTPLYQGPHSVAYV